MATMVSRRAAPRPPSVESSHAPKLLIWGKYCLTTASGFSEARVHSSWTLEVPASVRMRMDPVGTGSSMPLVACLDIELRRSWPYRPTVSWTDKRPRAHPDRDLQRGPAREGGRARVRSMDQLTRLSSVGTKADGIAARCFRTSFLPRALAHTRFLRTFLITPSFH
jgi:hypothetical protein